MIKHFKFEIFLLLLILFSHNAYCQRMGEPIKVTATKLSQDYTIFVSLPEGYNQNETHKYPVLYVLDANMHLDVTSSITHYLNGAMPQMIIVGIQQNNRNAELVPYINPAFQQDGEQKADDFLSFIEQDLKPFIDKNYASEAFSILSGHSYGGLFTLYAMAKKPELFSAYFAFSPSVWEGEYQVLNELKKHFEHNKVKQFLYTNIEAIDTVDWRLKHKTGFEKLQNLLNNTKTVHLNWHASVEKNEDHVTVALIGFYNAMRKLFPNWFLNHNLITKDKHNLEKHYTRLSNKYGYEVKALETDLYEYTHIFLRNNNLDTALHIAEYRLKLYPNSHFAMRTLADVFHAQNNQTSALLYINKAIKLAKKENHENLDSYIKKHKKFSL